MRINSAKSVSQLKFCILGNLVLAAAFSHAQERPGEMLPGLSERAVIMNIAARIIEHDLQIVWDDEYSRVTIPGRPVGLQLVGANIVVSVQFTPYFRTRGRNVLVAQGQIWINVPERGISYYTIMETIPLEFEEEIFFFPLGSAASQDDSFIEILVVVYPYLRDAVPDMASGEN